MKENMNKKRLTTRVLSYDQLQNCEKLIMYEILQKYIDSYSKEQFLKNLKEKDKIIIAKDKKHVIQCFTTIKFLKVIVDGIVYRGFFTGDTVVEHGYYKRHNLVGATIYTILKERFRYFRTPFYHFMVTNSHRSYLMIARHYKHYFPRYDYEPNEAEKSILNKFAETREGAIYNPNSQILKFIDSKERLNSAMIKIKEENKNKPELRYFLNKNPRYFEGDFLCCLCEMKFSNYKLITIFKIIKNIFMRNFGKLFYNKYIPSNTNE